MLEGQRPSRPARSRRPVERRHRRDIVAKSGSYFSYGSERLGQGRNNAKAFLEEHVEMAKEIEAKIYDAIGADRDLVQPIDPEIEADASDLDAAAGLPPVEQAA